jgi:hypothetical protein
MGTADSYTGQNTKLTVGLGRGVVELEMLEVTVEVTKVVGIS